MFDVSRKANTLRTARAKATLRVSAKTIELIRQQKGPKGDPLPVAKVAAIQAAKNTHQIIPYCHPLPVDFVSVDFLLGEKSIEITTFVKAIYKTGVEMEALTAASVAALTIYDMLKMVDESMVIQQIELVDKRGGKSDFKEHFKFPLRSAVLVMSDSIAAGKKQDSSGQMIRERLVQEGVDVVDYRIIPDEIETIREMLTVYADREKFDLVITTGGTGFSPRDCTPEAMKLVIEKEIPGIPDAIRNYGMERTPYSALSRGMAGIRGKTIIVNLPGSRKGVSESLDALFPAILHSYKMLWGGGHSRKMTEPG